MAPLDTRKWSLFMWAVKHQHCQTWLKYDAAQQMRELYNCSLPCILMFEVYLQILVTSPAPRLESLPSHSRQKQIRWDVLCQLQSTPNPCDWAFQGKEPLRCFWISPKMGFHPLRSDDIRLVALLYRTRRHKLHGSQVDLRLLFYEVSVCDKLRVELYNTSMILALI